MRFLHESLAFVGEQISFVNSDFIENRVLFHSINCLWFGPKIIPVKMIHKVTMISSNDIKLDFLKVTLYIDIYPGDDSVFLHYQSIVCVRARARACIDGNKSFYFALWNHNVTETPTDDKYNSLKYENDTFSMRLSFKTWSNTAFCARDVFVSLHG